MDQLVAKIRKAAGTLLDKALGLHRDIGNNALPIGLDETPAELFEKIRTLYPSLSESELYLLYLQLIQPTALPYQEP
jgi:hypothetical protein